jgi:hypothetical protein
LHTVALEDAQNLVAGDDLDLRDTVGVTEGDTNLRWCGALTGELADLVNDLLWGGLQPCWWCARVWDGGGTLVMLELQTRVDIAERLRTYALAIGMKTTHVCD